MLTLSVTVGEVIRRLTSQCLSCKGKSITVLLSMPVWGLPIPGGSGFHTLIQPNLSQVRPLDRILFSLVAAASDLAV